MTTARLLLLLVALLSLATPAVPARAADLPTATPEDVGLSSARLARITQTLRADVESGRIPGAVVLVARKGRVAYFEAVGFRDKAAGAPMTKDAIFRLASMTKPLATVAALSLWEEGRLQLFDPVSKYLPALADQKVGVEVKDPATGQVTLRMVAPDRPMTIQDLMRHTSGLTYGNRGTTAVHKLYPMSSTVSSQTLTGEELIALLGRTPLLHQPGTVWEYGLSTDVLGRVVEVVAGKPLSVVLDERIFRPLKMVDSAFVVGPDKQGRLAQPLPTHPDTGQPFTVPDVTSKRKFDCGGACAVATAADYARFAQMLANRGVLDGTRVLAPRTVDYMASDHLGTAIARGPAYAAGAGYTWGLGVAVRQESGIAPVAGSAGDYFWPGAWATYFWVDPKLDMVVVSLQQSPLGRHYQALMRSLVHQAVVD
jgi:CubicO group peptidase (beta-lactamase class C family)